MGHFCHRNIFMVHPTASKASSEVANLNERKTIILLYMVSKNLSVCLSVTRFDPNYSGVIKRVQGTCGMFKA